ncbi:MAG: helix-turn-helix domain-containing protein [Pedobacter sp.]|uniref:helix-turn-helix domain-containing protein n=1 Tax=Pedobacter sp. TaxID=1411316 RepID=UPI00339366BF
MKLSKPYHIKTINQFHQFKKLAKPEHPLITVIDVADLTEADETLSLTFDFYAISLKKNFRGKFKYGQQEYDFDEGIMLFISPGQIFRIFQEPNEPSKLSGWMLLIHPDFLWSTSLAKKMHQYDYFDYSSNEALFVSEKEEKILNAVVENIRTEHLSNIDKFSKDIIVSQLETLLNYAARFYSRQFITREKSNHQILEKVENILNSHFNSGNKDHKGIPSVKYLSDRLNVSASYLGSLLKSLTGENTQQHIHRKLIEKAKERLSTSDLSVSEIAHELGFEHVQSFSKLFRAKTNLSPLEFRHSFN